MARRRALVTAAFAAVTALVISAAPADAAAPSYVALGDSYSSGTGTRSYLADGTSCLRSVYAYPSLIASAKGYALNFRACSGAKIADVTDSQLSALTSSTAYVTISVGGNDAGFADVLTTCAQPAWLSNCNGAVDRAQSYIRNTLPGGADHPLREHPGPRAAGEGHRRRLPPHLQRRGLQPAHLVLAHRGEPAQRDRRPDQLDHGGARLGRRLRVRQPDAPASSGTPCATAPSGSTACRTRSSSPTTRTGRATPAATPPTVSPYVTGATVTATAALLTTARALGRPAGPPAARLRRRRPADRARGRARPRPHDGRRPGPPRQRAGVDLGSRASIDAADRLWSARQAAELARR